MGALAPLSSSRLARAYGAHAVACAELDLALDAESVAKSNAPGWCKRGARHNQSVEFVLARSASAYARRALAVAQDTWHAVVRAAAEAAPSAETAALAAAEAARAAEPRTRYSYGNDVYLLPVDAVRDRKAVAVGAAADIPAMCKSRREYVYEASFRQCDSLGNLVEPRRPLHISGRSIQSCLANIHDKSNHTVWRPVGTGAPYTVRRCLALDYAAANATRDASPPWHVVAAGNGADLRHGGGAA